MVVMEEEERGGRKPQNWFPRGVVSMGSASDVRPVVPAFQGENEDKSAKIVSYRIIQGGKALE